MPLKSGTQVFASLPFSSRHGLSFPLTIKRPRLSLRWNAWHQCPAGKRQENVMRQRNHPQDQPADTRAPRKAGNFALRAVQVALDRRDNGGDVYAGDDE